jgi:3-polyprenyl-4-hydroxybenzoate decarboxylase
MSQRDLLAALGARWQPTGNHKVYESMAALPIDPSIVTPGKGSKIAIDATIQWPEEGGRENFPSLNRTMLEQGAPDAFDITDQKFRDVLLNWRPGRA